MTLKLQQDLTSGGGGGGGDMMADLMSKLTLRRKGISGTKVAGEERAQERGVGDGGAMEKISLMIPPPPPAKADDQEEEEDLEDWE